MSFLNRFFSRDLLHDGAAHLPAGLQHLDRRLEHVQRHCHRPPLLLRGDLHEEVAGPPPHLGDRHRSQHHQFNHSRGEEKFFAGKKHVAKMYELTNIFGGRSFVSS